MSDEIPKRKAGRPSKPPEERRDKPTAVSMSSAERRAADDLAEILGVPRARAIAAAVFEVLESRTIPILVDRVTEKLRAVAQTYADAERKRLESAPIMEDIVAGRRFCVACELAGSAEQFARAVRSRPERRQEFLEALYAGAMQRRAGDYVASLFSQRITDSKERDDCLRAARAAVEAVVAEEGKVFGTDVVLFGFEVDSTGADRLYHYLEDIP